MVCFKQSTPTILRSCVALATTCLLTNPALALTATQRAVLFAGGPKFTYYVDSVHGSDSNNGQTPAMAFRNITRLPTITSGASVGLATDSWWRQELRINANNVKVSSYGSGARPILDGSDQVANASITKTGGFVYQTPSITFGVVSTAAWVNFFETGGPGDGKYGSYLSNVASESAVDSTPCSYFISGMVPDGTLPTSATIFFHSCDGTSPITNGYVYEYSNRSTGLFLNGLHHTVSGIETRKSADDLGSLQCQTDGASCIVTNVVARLGGKHNIFAGGGSRVYSSYLIDGYYSTTVADLLVFFDNTGSGLPIYIENNVFQQDQWPSGLSIASAISHTAGGSLGDVNFQSNWMIAKNAPSASPFGGVSFANVGTVTIGSSYGSQLGNFAAFQQAATLASSQAVSDSTNNNPVEILAAVPVTISASSFCGANEQNGIIFPSVSGVTLTLTNNKLYPKTPVAIAPEALHAPNAISLTSNGNDIGSNSTGGYYAYNNFAASGSTFMGDNNLYENTNAPNIGLVLNNTSAANLPAWQSQTGQDAHSSFGNGAASDACSLPTIPNVE